jgi:hypothetical protein
LEITCQRCHETLRETDRYCPVCGLPQLIYLAAETPAAAGEGAAEYQDGGIGGLAGMTDGIAWRLAIKAAIVLAIPAGVLCSGIGPLLGLFWMGGAAAWAVGLYFRRARPGWLTLTAGARIGLVTGLFASWLTLTVNGVALWVSRFVLHQGGQMDSQWLTAMTSGQQKSQQMVAQMGLTSVQSMQVAESAKYWQAWMLSPEGRAGLALSTFLFGAVFLIFFAMIGGALGARLLAQPRRPSA